MPDPDSQPPSPSPAPTPPRVLVADASLSNRRLIREALGAFRHCEVDDASNAEHAFERALQRTYALFIFSMTLPDMPGTLLDRLLSRIYPRIHPDTHTAPQVIYLVRADEMPAFHEIQRHARVRGATPLPLNLEELLKQTAGLLPKK
jgi:CheY-like chemotaxis protein